MTHSLLTRYVISTGALETFAPGVKRTERGAGGPPDADADGYRGYGIRGWFQATNARALLSRMFDEPKPRLGFVIELRRDAASCDPLALNRAASNGT